MKTTTPILPASGVPARGPGRGAVRTTGGTAPARTITLAPRERRRKPDTLDFDASVGILPKVEPLAFVEDTAISHMRPVRNDDGDWYDSLTAAAEALKTLPQSIYQAIARGHRYKGHHWRYADSGRTGDGYVDGYEARVAGKSIEENPYTSRDQNHALWEIGWRDAQEEL